MTDVPADVPELLPAAGTRAEAPALTGRTGIRLRTWRIGLFAADLVFAGLAAVVGLLIRFGEAPTGVQGRSNTLLAILLPGTWVLTLAAVGAYDRASFSSALDELNRLVHAGAWLVAGTALISFLVRAELSRGFLAIAFGVLGMSALLSRSTARALVRRHFRSGRAMHRVVVVGSSREVRPVIAHLRRAAAAGYRVVGVCTPGEVPAPDLPAGVEHLAGPAAAVFPDVERLQADTIVIAGAQAMSSECMRTLAEAVEGRGVHLLVAPAISEVAGLRVRVRAIDGLPLIEKPQFRGGRRIGKDAFDRLAAGALLLAFAPLFAVIAVAIRVTSPGPVFFTQERVGRDGLPFVMWKFRTMRVGAHRERADLEHLNDNDGVLFKIRDDPRITRVGRWLRRYSLDELPQLINVFMGSMSLVGPRPPLASEVSRFDTRARRRLLVKPGMTGLWQVNGRADLPWEEAVRLDVCYIENWSPITDLTVLWNTLGAVLGHRGAY